MNKFELATLPKCGAKTRSGSCCQRYGTKANGRCKLHGGRSTGAKTREGKLKIRTNAIVHSTVWHVDNVLFGNIKQEDYENAVNAYLRLIELCVVNDSTAYNEAMELTNQYRVELEMVKFAIARSQGAEALLLIQSALDQFYKEDGSKHLSFHVQTHICPPIFFASTELTPSQFAAQITFDMRAQRKHGDDYNYRVRNCAFVRNYQKELKQHQMTLWD
ncbi:HGGxSTG domain-containing protein [Shewanella xiamenensis]|uniref:HGGxSTG domain-containing protein n=1 Tax=Shewanella xiamenensis TaxID=332186 RepID=UPI0024A678BA|nr:HGGxSTG domain-containing protein [Shewanella xiamenensis]MDI5837814.1 hypothetical protein [Shewanella xiamenensis]MDI5841153.1 hypothetical protein [Shewanella xiamenensis]MDI5845652.1 hypothetical protein [Shewanella xiamenensis]MDI5848491.1 hypothetical protein [Shewanella xiamenensis]MDI5852845.1 hypothetical protein [Shewanella xiamenensis]